LALATSWAHRPLAIVTHGTPFATWKSAENLLASADFRLLHWRVEQMFAQ